MANKVSTGYPISVGDQVYIGIKARAGSKDFHPFLVNGHAVCGTVISISDTSASIRVKFANGVEIPFKRNQGFVTLYLTDGFGDHWDSFNLYPESDPSQTSRIVYDSCKYPTHVYLIKDTNHLELLNLSLESVQGISLDGSSSGDLERKANATYSLYMKAANIAKSIGR